MSRSLLNTTATTERPHISKSKFLQGIQCKKLLWFAYNEKDQIPETDAAQQAIFDQGHDVGALAKSLFPGAVEVGEGVTDFEQVLQQSLEAVKSRKPLFEAGFVYNDGFARVDILNPVGENEWDIIEVKSSTGVKDVNLTDLAFQAFIYNGAGLKIRRCYVMHVNHDYVRCGAINPKKFFKRVNVTKRVSALSKNIEAQLKEMFATIRLSEHPEIKIGSHCNNPYPCGLQDKCWAFLPDHSVFDLYYGGKKPWRLLGDGISRLKDIPDDIDLTDRQTIQRTVALTGQPHINRKALARFLKRLKHPISFVDFETINTAIPLFDGLTPYQQVPFQFSLHRVAMPGSEPEHHAFLSDGRIDPRPLFLNRLLDCIGTKGSVVVYNAPFEKSVLGRLAEAFPEHAGWIKNVKRRIIDLLEPFQKFHYYHPNQQGSASIKSVLPVLTGRSYAGLEIQEGVQAGLEFLRINFGDVTDDERSKVRKELEQYCGQDTEGMTWIIEAIERICG